MSAARRLVFAALALRGVDIVLGPWGSPPQVLSLLWALVLTVTAIALRARPRAGTGVVLFVAFVVQMKLPVGWETMLPPVVAGGRTPFAEVTKAVSAPVVWFTVKP